MENTHAEDEMHKALEALKHRQRIECFGVDCIGRVEAWLEDDNYLVVDSEGHSVCAPAAHSGTRDAASAEAAAWKAVLVASSKSDVFYLDSRIWWQPSVKHLIMRRGTCLETLLVEHDLGAYV